MAPEVLWGEVYDERADIFSFGVVLAEMITRRPPGKNGFLERHPRTKFKMDIDQLRAAAPPDTPPSLLELAASCLAYEAEYRLTTEVCSGVMTAASQGAVAGIECLLHGISLTSHLPLSASPLYVTAPQDALEWLVALVDELEDGPASPPPSVILGKSTRSSGQFAPVTAGTPVAVVVSPDTPASAAAGAVEGAGASSE
jgi:hypothetical protein